MISFNLSCHNGHLFEGLFGSSADYDQQLKQGLVACPICDSTKISKAPMTPNVAAKSNQRKTNKNTAPQKPPQIPQKPSAEKTMQITPEMQTQMAETFAKMRQFQKIVEAKCDDVGDDFAEEARKIHYGEATPRGIYGQTTDEDAESLIDEGIEITKMPWLPKEH